MDAASQRDIINRFGLETIDSGSIRIRLNVAYQDNIFGKMQRKTLGIIKSIEKIETRKLVMNYSL